MKNWTLQLAVSLGVATAPTIALAQGTPNATAGLPSTAVQIEEKTGDAPGSSRVVSNPIDMFRGWSQLYKGYDRTPILFDDTKYGRTRGQARASFLQNTPGNRFTPEEQKQMRETSLKVFNLGVDDELKKTSMTIYQPLHLLASDFAEDQMERDRNLDLFKTFRGTAIMTLSYLDKTVAAGIATTQAQVDAHTTNQLLKQLNWTSTKLANPSRAPLYQDVDEKVEVCLRFGSNKAWPETGRVPFSPTQVCALECRDPKYGIPNGVGSGGAYDYCVCCGEVVAALNRTYRDGSFNPADKNVGNNAGFSLVDKIFIGTEGPKGDIPPKQRDLYRDNIANFRELYGDILLSPCNSYSYQGSGGDEQTDAQTCKAGTDKIEFRFPELSVADKVKLFRDGLPNPEACADRSGSGCPIVGLPIKEGICPAIHKIMVNWPPSSNEVEQNELRELWLQASLGRLLTGDDINNMFIMAQLEPGELKGIGFNQSVRRMNDAGWNKVSTRFKRYLNVFCDSMAVSAFKKYHYRMMSITEDQLRINQKATDYDKGKLRDLMARVSTQIELAERDLESSSVSDRMLAGLDTEADRERVGRVMNSSEANRNAWSNAQRDAVSAFSFGATRGANTSAGAP